MTQSIKPIFITTAFWSHLGPTCHNITQRWAYLKLSSFGYLSKWWLSSPSAFCPGPWFWESRGLNKYHQSHTLNTEPLQSPGLAALLLPRVRTSNQVQNNCITVMATVSRSGQGILCLLLMVTCRLNALIFQLAPIIKPLKPCVEPPESCLFWECYLGWQRLWPEDTVLIQMACSRLSSEICTLDGCK